MCCAIRKILRSYRRTSSLKASRSPFLAAWTSASSLVIPSSAFFWMVSMPLRLKINLLCLPGKGLKSQNNCFYLDVWRNDLLPDGSHSYEQKLSAYILMFPVGCRRMPEQGQFRGRAYKSGNEEVFD